MTEPSGRRYRCTFHLHLHLLVQGQEASWCLPGVCVPTWGKPRFPFDALPVFSPQTPASWSPLHPLELGENSMLHPPPCLERSRRHSSRPPSHQSHSLWRQLHASLPRMIPLIWLQFIAYICKMIRSALIIFYSNYVYIHIYILQFIAYICKTNAINTKKNYINDDSQFLSLNIIHIDTYFLKPVLIIKMRIRNSSCCCLWCLRWAPRLTTALTRIVRLSKCSGEHIVRLNFYQPKWRFN